MTGFIGPLPEVWQAFPWLYHGYRELLSNVHRFGIKNSKTDYQYAHDRKGHILNNPRIAEYFSATSFHTEDESQPWCSAFVNWCMLQANMKRTNSAHAQSWLKVNLWDGERLPFPMPGAIVVLKRPPKPTDGHVAMIYKVRHDGSIDILGGNQDGHPADRKHHLAGISSRVSITTKSQNDVINYLWPKSAPKAQAYKATQVAQYKNHLIPSRLRPRDWHV